VVQGAYFYHHGKASGIHFEKPLLNTNFEWVRLNGELKKKPILIVKVFTRDPYSNIPLFRQYHNRSENLQERKVMDDDIIPGSV
jgi:hypothetical protein